MSFVPSRCCGGHARCLLARRRGGTPHVALSWREWCWARARRASPRCSCSPSATTRRGCSPASSALSL
jgi:hypothetical protein